MLLASQFASKQCFLIQRMYYSICHTLILKDNAIYKSITYARNLYGSVEGTLPIAMCIDY